MMQAEKALELQKAWGDRPCDHPALAKEYDRGSATGDYVCKQCGQSGWGKDWNKPDVVRKGLEAEFGQAMHGIYKRALSEAGYKASIFLSMVIEHGGVETARRLLQSQRVSDGYTALWERKRLDLTVEAMIYGNPKWHSLFTLEELAICRKRLREYEYLPAITEARRFQETASFRG